METKDLRLVMEYVSVLWWATWVARWFLEWTLLDVCQFWSLTMHDKMLHWSRLAVFWRESKRFPNVPNGATKGFTDVFSNIWMHHRPTSTLKDSYATREQVTPITAANKCSLDIKNRQFSHLLIFSLRQSDVVGRRLEEGVQSGDKVQFKLISPHDVSL